ncbi:MAG TPA: hypothetical protein VH134_03355 [Candidatus Dormibacteraeota bacterium]|nr:hypothetical protein [Candidatus Dormibacteraeota bacterium]
MSKRGLPSRLVQAVALSGVMMAFSTNTLISAQAATGTFTYQAKEHDQRSGQDQVVEHGSLTNPQNALCHTLPKTSNSNNIWNDFTNNTDVTATVYKTNDCTGPQPPTSTPPSSFTLPPHGGTRYLGAEAYRSVKFG